MSHEKGNYIPHAVLICVFFFVLILLQSSFADNNVEFNISSLCPGGRSAPTYKEVEGAVITSDDDSDVSCIVTFQTHSILQLFMLRFEHLTLGCEDHLFIFDGPHAIGNYMADLSCRATVLDVGTVFTRSNFVTLRFSKISSRPEGNGFKLIVTALKSPKLLRDNKDVKCRAFECRNTFCVSRSLICDGVNHCGDNSDEEICAPHPRVSLHSLLMGLATLFMRLLFALLGKGTQ